MTDQHETSSLSNVDSNSNHSKISVVALKKFAGSLLKKKGMFKAEANLVIERLIEADLYGIQEGGSIRIGEIIHAINMGEIEARAQIGTVLSADEHLILDANGGVGSVAISKAIDQLSRKATEKGRAFGLVNGLKEVGPAALFSALGNHQNQTVVCITGEKTDTQPTCYWNVGDEKTCEVYSRASFHSFWDWMKNVGEELSANSGNIVGNNVVYQARCGELLRLAQQQTGRLPALKGREVVLVVDDTPISQGESHVKTSSALDELFAKISLRSETPLADPQLCFRCVPYQHENATEGESNISVSEEEWNTLSQLGEKMKVPFPPIDE